jgi:hypothetical protein
MATMTALPAKFNVPISAEADPASEDRLSMAITKVDGRIKPVRPKPTNKNATRISFPIPAWLLTVRRVRIPAPVVNARVQLRSRVELRRLVSFL